MSTLLKTFKQLASSNNKDLIDDIKDYIFADREERKELREEVAEEIAINDERAHQLGEFRYANTTDHSLEYKLSLFRQIDKHMNEHPILGKKAPDKIKQGYLIDTLDKAIEIEKSVRNNQYDAVLYKRHQEARGL